MKLWGSKNSIIPAMERARQERWAGLHPEPPRHTSPAWSHLATSTSQYLGRTTPMVWLLSPPNFLRGKATEGTVWLTFEGLILRGSTVPLHVTSKKFCQKKSVTLTPALLSYSPCLQCPAFSPSCPAPSNSLGLNCPSQEDF